MTRALLAALALAAHVAVAQWQVVNMDLATIALDVSCNLAGSCIAPVVINGAGSAVLYTRDGGKSWTKEPSAFEMMYLGGTRRISEMHLVESFSF